MLNYLYISRQNTKIFGYRAKNTTVLMPTHISNPQNVYMYDYTRIQGHSKIITYTGKFIMKKYSGAAPGLTVITGKHIPTVGIPYFFLPISRINDIEKDVIIEEDVWIGANVTILSGVTIGRGSVIGACSVVTKDIPPYAVVAGNPSKIIASKFTIEEILIHENKIYSKEECFSKEYLDILFSQFYQNKKTIGKNIDKENQIRYDNFLKHYKK